MTQPRFTRQNLNRPQTHSHFFAPHDEKIWYDLLLLCLGTCFHFIILHPATLRDHAFIAPGLRSLTLQCFLLTQVILLLSGLAISLWHQHKQLFRSNSAGAAPAAQQLHANSGHNDSLADAFQATPARPSSGFYGANLLVWLPLPWHIFFAVAAPSSSLLGLVAVLLQARLLRLSVSCDSQDNVLTFRRLRSINPRQHGLLPTASLRLTKLALGGMGIITLYQAGAALPANSPMMVAAILFAITALLYSIKCESKTWRQRLLISAWQKKHLIAAASSGARGRQPILSRLRSFAAAFSYSYAATVILSIIFCLSLTYQRFWPYAFLALLLRQIAAYIFLCSSHPDFSNFWERLIERPGHLLINSFIALIFCGGLILSLPICGANGHSIGLGNSLFTATSAVCVTGLNTIEPGVDLSIVGQTALTLLIQLGGLGIMTISLFVAMLISRHFGIQADAAVREMTGEERNQAAQKLLRAIVIGTFALEAAGAAILAMIYYHDLNYSAMASIGHACFLSINSFCNAGFSLHGDSLAIFANHCTAQIVVSLLVILGGISFLVLLGLGHRLTTKRHQKLPLGAQERLVITVTGLLLAGATILFFLFENQHGFQQFNAKMTLSNAFFLAASARTAGFTTVDLPTLSNASQFLLMVLIFIGAAPGSTAGGVKVTSVAVLFLLLRAWVSGERDVVYARRRIPPAVIMQAAATVSLALAVAVAACLALALAMPQENAMNIAFEVISAMGTAGFNQGLTERLPEAGKLIIMLLMLLGKVGLLTVLVALRQKKSTKLQYADTRILI